MTYAEAIAELEKLGERLNRLVDSFDQLSDEAKKRLATILKNTINIEEKLLADASELKGPEE